MAKALKTAATIVGVVVAIAAAIPTGGASAAGGATLLSSVLGTSVATASFIAAGVGLVSSAVAMYAAKALSKNPPPTISGGATAFTIADDRTGLLPRLWRTEHSPLAPGGWP